MHDRQLDSEYAAIDEIRMKRNAVIKQNKNIKPDHYKKGEIDLFESAYLTYPFNEFRAIMQFVAERYMKRDKIDRIEDLDKCIETLTRLRAYELRHKEE